MFIAERLILDAGYTLIEDRSWFQDKHYHSGIPDVYYLHEERNTNRRGQRRDVSVKYCVEIETNPTNASSLEKFKQFEQSCVGHKVIIVPLNKCDDPYNLNTLKEFINRYIM